VYLSGDPGLGVAPSALQAARLEVSERGAAPAPTAATIPAATVPLWLQRNIVLMQPTSATAQAAAPEAVTAAQLATAETGARVTSLASFTAAELAKISAEGGPPSTQETAYFVTLLRQGTDRATAVNSIVWKRREAPPAPAPAKLIAPSTFALPPLVRPVSLTTPAAGGQVLEAEVRDVRQPAGAPPLLVTRTIIDGGPEKPAAAAPTEAAAPQAAGFLGQYGKWIAAGLVVLVLVSEFGGRR
jgi:hypothetical protein